jgi:TM2 domain-containing membrane protein YozV
MFCRQCGQQLPDGSVACSKCGAPTGLAPVAPAQPAMMGAPGVVPKSKNTYAILGALVGLLGFPGIHNLYAGYTTKGMVQLLVSVLSCWLLWIFMFVWAIVDICTVTQDSNGQPFSA